VGAMAKSKKLDEIDLRPYQTHFLFQSDTAITSKRLNSLLDELKSVVDDPPSENGESSEIIEQAAARRIENELLGWLHYSRKVAVRWATGPAAPKDIENHLVVIVSRSTLLTVVASEKSLGNRLARSGSTKEWSKLKRLDSRQLEKALVSGKTRTLWLSGIHRSVAVKPDSKVLIGRDIEASLDALGDQTYQYTSTRCEGPAQLPASFVGVTPRMAKVWLGPSADWEVFIANSQELLRLIESPGQKNKQPYPILARANRSLKDVGQAFDVSFAAPEYLHEEAPELEEELEDFMQTATWTVKGEKGADCVLKLKLPDGEHELRIELKVLNGEIQHFATPVEADPPEDLKKIVEWCNRPDLLKIFYDSVHTYSDGQIFAVTTRPLPFELTDEDFSGFDVSLEKPRPVGANNGVDLSRIGVPNEPSLFTWVWKRHKKGWLWCDDGSGEIADFIHLDPNRSVLSLIHVKAANSDSPQRGISVSAYEVVCSQALKNLRYTERSELEIPLKEKLMRTKSKIQRGWLNGKPLPLGSTALWSAIKGIRYSELKHRVIVVQPHVRKSSLPTNPSANTSSSRQARLLYTLLHGIDADVRRYSAEFEVIVAK
jgi:hypothetical protein